jgi:hypothetical protein
MPEHGPGAATRNARTRYADTANLLGPAADAAERFSVVEQRDLAVYEQMLGVA